MNRLSSLQFSSGAEHLKLAVVLFQNLFPPINVQTVKLGACQACVRTIRRGKSNLHHTINECSILNCQGLNSVRFDFGSPSSCSRYSDMHQSSLCGRSRHRITWVAPVNTRHGKRYSTAAEACNWLCYI